MIITRMVVNMDESKLSTIEQIEAFLSASEQVAFMAHAGDTERYAHISRVLRRFDYPRRGKRECGVLLVICATPAATAAPSSPDWCASGSATA